MREFFPDPITCPVGNTCRFNGAPDVECGSINAHVQTLLRAEQVCLYALINRVDAFDTNTPHANEQLEITQAAIELGLATRDDAIAAICFDSAEVRFADMQASEEQGHRRWIAAGQGKAYMPAFRERRLYGTVSVDTIATVHKSLGEVGEALLKDEGLTLTGFISQHPQLRGGLGEILISSLLIRLRDPKIFPWLALNREDEARGDQTPFNHDAYLLELDGKLALQFKYGRIRKPQSEEYDPDILKLSFREIAAKTFTDMQEVLHMPGHERPQRVLIESLLATAIIKEAQGEKAEEVDRIALSCASSVVMRAIHLHRKKMAECAASTRTM